ncbi:MAG: hypothetical protein QME49_09520 [bacterium]|nr:hypothetical protein [bacterium]
MKNMVQLNTVNLYRREDGCLLSSNQAIKQSSNQAIKQSSNQAILHTLNNLKILYLLAVISFFLPFDTFAKSVKVDDILAYPKEWQIDISVSYANIHKQTGKSSLSLIELPDESFIVIPSYAGEEGINEDYISYSLGLRYGITKRLEISSFVNLHSDFQRMILNSQTKQEENHKFDLLDLGVSYQAVKEGKHPALLALFSTHLIDNQKFDNGYKENYLRTYLVSLLSYYTVDPIVFMLQTKYQLNLKRINGDDVIDPGEVISISPQIYFAAGPYISLNYGVQWICQGKTRIKNETTDILQTDMTYLFGASYGIKNNLTLSFDGECKNTLDGNQTSLTGKLNYRF